MATRRARQSTRRVRSGHRASGQWCRWINEEEAAEEGDDTLGPHVSEMEEETWEGHFGPYGDTSCIHTLQVGPTASKT